VLRQFAWGVPAFVLARAFTLPSLARQKSKRPMQSVPASVFITVVVASLLVLAADRRRGRHDRPWHCDLVRRLGKRLPAGQRAGAGRGLHDGRPGLRSRMVRLIIASAIMGVFAGVCARQYPLLSELLWKKEVAVLVVIAVGVVLYGIAAFACRQ